MSEAPIPQEEAESAVGVMDAAMLDYRGKLVALFQSSCEQYDKAVLTLSGGALAVSIAFLEKIVTPEKAKCELFAGFAWLFWTLSILCVLFSFHYSKRALTRAIRQVDTGTIRNSKPGGEDATTTESLNIAGGILFGLGALSFSSFALLNIWK